MSFCKHQHYRVEEHHRGSTPLAFASHTSEDVHENCCFVNFGQVPRNTFVTQHSCEVGSKLFQSVPSENCFLMLLVMKNIWESVNPVCKNMPQFCKIMIVQINCPSVVPMLFKSIGKTLQQFVWN